MIYAIPTYHRPHTIKTVDYLLDLGVHKDDICISIQDKEDLQDYKDTIKKVGEVFFAKKHNAAGNRNTILDNLPSGEEIMFFEDDCNGIFYVTYGNPKIHWIKDAEELHSFCKYGFEVARSLRTPMFGFSLMQNAFFMSSIKKRISQKKIPGRLFGIINNKIRFDENLDVCDDTEYCLHVIAKYGSLPVFNRVSSDNNRFMKGGCHEQWQDKNNKNIALKTIELRYSNLVNIKPNKENAITLRK